MSIRWIAYHRPRKPSVTKAGLPVLAFVLSLLSAVSSQAAQRNLYAFRTRPAPAPAGSYPQGTLLRDASGALYGATWGGGTSGHGTIFKLSPPPTGQTTWNMSVLYEFRGGDDGSHPNGTLAMDSTGAIYGTAADGGSALEGVAFKLTPPVAPGTGWN